MTIEILSPQVIDQISAGEVVERPAHLVKELVENSLDAGAQNIEVDFSEGGRQVTVKDDGCGMSVKDLTLSVARHATSKIKIAEDLWSLSTYGFRGEALASISAVSDFTLVSREEHSSTAYSLNCHFGQIDEAVEVGGDQGTLVQVKKLFENIPVRKKFLKSDLAESSQIKQVLKAMALSSPQVNWRVRSAGELLFFWPRCSSLKERVEQILELSPLYSAVDEGNSCKIKVVYSAPHQVIRNSRQIWLFVRGRWITDRSLVAAVVESYRHLLMKGEFPIVALWLDVPAEDVDVNIHPTKSQVKFRQPSTVFRTIVHVLRSSLEKAPWVADIVKASPTLDFNDYHNNYDFEVEKYVSKMEAKQEPKNQATLSFSNPELERTQFKQIKQFKQIPVSSQVHEARSEERSYQSHPQRSYVWASLQIVGQAHLTYIVTQSPRSLILIDQHAAHERILFETLLKSWKGGRREIQSYLIPFACELLPEQIEVLMRIKPELEPLGVSIALNSSGEVEITSGPALVLEAALIKGLQKLAEDLLEHGESFELDHIVGDLLATLACHSAIRAGQALSVDEMKALLGQMDEYSFSSFCPHGRPVFIDIPLQEIERDFGRLG